jgi:hypothetical protein
MTDAFFDDRLKERCSLRIRRDVVFISSVLFTIALVWFIRPAWWNVLAGYGDMRGLDPWKREALRSVSNVGKLMLTLIIIGLIVAWTGYLNKVRWTWFVMFVVVSGLTFQTDILPLFMHPKVFLDLPGLFVDAWKGEHLARIVLEEILIFLLMVIALLLPAKSFFSRRTSPAV